MGSPEETSSKTAAEPGLAEAHWRAVLAVTPSNVSALLELGALVLRRGDHSEAQALLERARSIEPNNIGALLCLAEAERRSDNVEGEGRAIEAALVLDPYCLPALLAKASRLERIGARVDAARYYQAAIRIAPPVSRLPPPIREKLDHAQAMTADFSARLETHLNAETSAAAARLPTPALARWREAISIMAGAAKPFHSLCNQMTVPRLAATPFFETGEFAWASSLEAKTDIIRGELERLLRAGTESFAPYIDMAADGPIDQWRELNRSRKWSTFPLWRNGQPASANLEKCPETARALAATAMADIPGLCPNAMFSLLEPRTHIPPHHGETNARLVAHLPLIVPDGCWLRVGCERRRWETGELLVFDDTIEHEAANESDEIRIVLIFDVWNPRLEAAECEMARRLMSASYSFAY